MTAVQYHEGSFPPDDCIDWCALIPLIGQTSAAVARYDGALATVPNPHILLSPLITQEAVLSSRIEGTQATLGEVLEYEAGQAPTSPERRDDIVEIINYREAIREAERMLDKLPLCMRVVQAAHRTLMSGARGANKAPGEFRRIQNWIGPPGSDIHTATYVPIAAGRLPDAFARWEKYINDETPDPLVQLAVLHAEFEALHPFLDGNGRLGRLLIPLFLWQKGLIAQPMFYISAYFEENRSAYYEGLLRVSRDDDWTGWCRFFLQALQVQAKHNLGLARAILDLYEDMKPRVANAIRSRHAISVLDLLFEHPIISSTAFSARSRIPPRTARRIIERLCEQNLLQEREVGSGRKPALLIFGDLLRLTDKETAL